MTYLLLLYRGNKRINSPWIILTIFLLKRLVKISRIHFEGLNFILKDK